MYKHLLVPVDGSPLAEHVLPLVRTLAQESGARVTVLRVTPEPVHSRGNSTSNSSTHPDPMPLTMQSANWYLAADPKPRAQWIERAVEAAQSYVDGIVALLARDGIHARALVVPGVPSRAILEVARLHEADLIAMSTHGRSGIDRIILGSTADYVLRHADVPVLLIRADETSTDALPVAFRRILVPLDGSALADEILPSVQQFAQQSNSEVLLLRVLPEQAAWPDETDAFVFSGGMLRVGTFEHGTEGYPDSAETQLSRNARHAIESAQGALDIVSAQLARAGLRVETLIQEGDAAETILDVAKRCQADLIAMSSHGRTGLTRVIFGSVAEHVLEGARVPLLVKAHRAVLA